jgi:hypothetical protein
MKEEKMEKEQHQINSISESTDIFLLKNSSCSPSTVTGCSARKSLRNAIYLVLVTLSIVSSVSFSIFPVVTHASTPDNYSGLVKCSGVVQNNGEKLCNFQTFISMVGTTINWLFVIAIPVAVALFAWAGLLYMSGKDDNKKQARTIFLNVVIGFIIMLVAFVVVKTLVGWVVNSSFGATTFLGS